MSGRRRFSSQEQYVPLHAIAWLFSIGFGCVAWLFSIGFGCVAWLFSIGFGCVA